MILYCLPPIRVATLEFTVREAFNGVMGEGISHLRGLLVMFTSTSCQSTKSKIVTSFPKGEVPVTWVDYWTIPRYWGEVLRFSLPLPSIRDEVVDWTIATQISRDNSRVFTLSNTPSKNLGLEVICRFTIFSIWYVRFGLSHRCITVYET